MRKLFVMGAMMAFTAMLASCEVYGLVKDATDKEDGRIVTTSGKTYTGRVETPNANTKKLTIVMGENDKVVVDAKDIETLLMWKKTHPDMKHVLKYLPSYWLNGKERKPMWMTPVNSGKYLEIYACSFDYTITQSGDLKVTSIKNGSINYYALKRGETKPRAFGMTDLSKRQTRKYLLEYLSDDPVLCKKLTDLEISPYDFDKIVEQYQPRK